MGQIYWGCCSPFISSLFIKLGPPVNIYSPTVSKLEIFRSLQLRGPLRAGSGEVKSLLRWRRPEAHQTLPAGRQEKKPWSPFAENEPHCLLLEQLFSSSHLSTLAPNKGDSASSAHPCSPVESTCASRVVCRAVFTSWCQWQQGNVFSGIA